VFFFSCRRRRTRSDRDWSSDVCSSDLGFSLALSAASAKLDATFGSSSVFGGLFDRRRDRIFGERLLTFAVGGAPKRIEGSEIVEIGRASCRERGENEVGAGDGERTDGE